MGKITGSSPNKFKSAKYIYAKIKRELTGFGAANLIDDADFPLYTAEVLKLIGGGTFKESEALLFVKNGKACLPADLMYLYAAYKCNCTSTTSTKNSHLQNRQTIYTDTTHDMLQCSPTCDFATDCDDSKLISRITIRQYVNDDCIEHNFSVRGLLKLSPNVKEQCADDCLNFHPTCNDEITINNGYVFTNFKDGDIYLQYYAFPYDENGQVEIPDIPSVEKVVENYIRYQILLKLWFTGELQDAQSKWQKAEQMYLDALAQAQYIDKLPTFSKFVDSIRNQRKINKMAFFAQIDRTRN